MNIIDLAKELDLFYKIFFLNYHILKNEEVSMYE